MIPSKDSTHSGPVHMQFIWFRGLHVMRDSLSMHVSWELIGDSSRKLRISDHPVNEHCVHFCDALISKWQKQWHKPYCPTPNNKNQKLCSYALLAVTSKRTSVGPRCSKEIHIRLLLVPNAKHVICVAVVWTEIRHLEHVMLGLLAKEHLVKLHFITLVKQRQFGWELAVQG